MEYKICCGNAVALVNTYGGELTSFSRDNIEYIWNGDDKYWSSHSPVLFPTVGSLKNNETEIGGVKYPIKKHGFARKCKFELVEHSEQKVIFSLKSNDETKKAYPFDFELIVAHTIFEDGFKTEYTVMNNDSKDLIFGIGGHTGFNCPLFKDTIFSDYYIEYEQVENGAFYYTRSEDCGGIIHKEDRIYNLEGKNKLQLDYSLFDRDVIILDEMKSKTIKLLNTKNSSGVSFTMNGFNSLGIWTPPLKNAPFVCLEPWTVTPDFSDHNGKFEDKPNVTALSPKSSNTVSYEMKII
jgi:galactose mutarotase-like enzyme